MVELIAYYALLAAFGAFMGYLIIDSVSAMKMFKDLKRQFEDELRRLHDDSKKV